MDNHSGHLMNEVRTSALFSSYTPSKLVRHTTSERVSGTERVKGTIIFFQYAGLSQHVDKRISKLIDDLVGEGVRNVREMERSINIYVKKELFPDKPLPPKTSRRFFPELNDIRNHMSRSVNKHRHSKIDQENVRIKIETWRDTLEDKFHFRPYKKNDGESSTENVKEQLFFNERGDFIGEVRKNFFLNFVNLLIFNNPSTL